MSFSIPCHMPSLPSSRRPRRPDLARRRPRRWHHVAAVHPRRRHRRPRRFAPTGRPRRPSRSRLGPSTATAARPGQSLSKPQGPRQLAPTHGRAPPHRRRARDVTTRLSAVADPAADLVGALPPAGGCRGGCVRWCDDPGAGRVAGCGHPAGSPAGRARLPRRRSPHLAVVAGMALVAATLAYVTQRYLVAPNTVTDGLPEAMARAQQLMPALSAVGLLVAGGVVPVALLAYWVCNSMWTLASQRSSGAGSPRQAHRRPAVLSEGSGNGATARLVN